MLNVRLLAATNDFSERQAVFHFIFLSFGRQPPKNFKQWKFATRMPMKMVARMEVKSTDATWYRGTDLVLHSAPLYLRIFSN